MCRNCINANEYGDCMIPAYMPCIMEATRKEERRLQEGGTPIVTVDGYEYEFVEHLGQYAVYSHATKALVGYDDLPQGVR